MFNTFLDTNEIINNSLKEFCLREKVLVDQIFFV